MYYFLYWYLDKKDFLNLLCYYMWIMEIMIFFMGELVEKGVELLVYVNCFG